MLSKKWKFLCEHCVIEKIKLQTITWQNKDKQRLQQLNRAQTDSAVCAYFNGDAVLTHFLQLQGTACNFKQNRPTFQSSLNHSCSVIPNIFGYALFHLLVFYSKAVLSKDVLAVVIASYTTTPQRSYLNEYLPGTLQSCGFSADFEYLEDIQR